MKTKNNTYGKPISVGDFEEFQLLFESIDPPETIIVLNKNNDKSITEYKVKF